MGQSLPESLKLPIHSDLEKLQKNISQTDILICLWILREHYLTIFS